MVITDDKCVSPLLSILLGSLIYNKVTTNISVK